MAKKKGRRNSGSHPKPKKENPDENTNQEFAPMARQLGKAIFVLRGKLRMSQQQLAAEFPELLKQGYISKVEKGQVFPRQERLSAIVKALRTTHKDLWALAEQVDRFDLDSDDSDKMLSCISHTQLGNSYEDVRDIYEAVDQNLDDVTVAELETVEMILSNGKKLNRKEMDQVRGISDRVESLPSDIAVLRMFTKRVIGLLTIACEKHALATSK